MQYLNIYERKPVVYVARLKRNIDVSCVISWPDCDASDEDIRKIILSTAISRLSKVWEIHIDPEDIELFVATLEEF